MPTVSYPPFLSLSLTIGPVGDAVVLDDPPLGDLDAADVGRHDAAHVGRHASSRPQSSRHGHLVLRRSSANAASPSNGRSDRVPNHPHVAIRRDGLAHANHGHAANESHAAKAVTRESVEFFQVQYDETCLNK